MGRVRLTDRPRPDPAKQAARSAGLQTFLGSKCKNEHDGLRYSSTGHCVECIRIRNIERKLI